MKIVEISETITASVLKVGRSRHLIDFMKLSEYCRSRSFLDLRSRSFLDLGSRL